MEALFELSGALKYKLMDNRNYAYDLLKIVMAERLSKAKLSYFRKLKQKKMRDAEAVYLVEGWHLLEAALLSGVIPESLVYDESRVLASEQQEWLERAEILGVSVFSGTADQLQQVSETQASQGVFALMKKQRLSFDQFYKTWEKRDEVRLLAMDAIGDPGNCGSILRSADWFGLNGAILGEGSCELENGKVVRSTMGALFHMPILVGVPLAQMLGKLRAMGFAVLTAELGGAVDLYTFVWPKKCILVIGNEARGVSEDVSNASTHKIMIPKFGRSESLNAAMAASVIMSHWRASS